MKPWWKKELWKTYPERRVTPFNRRPDRIPPAYWKHLISWRNIWIFAYITLLALLVTNWLALRTGNSHFLPAIIIIGISFHPAWWLTTRSVRKNMLAKLSENENLVCLECGYVLTGLPDNHQCPECGAEYNAKEIKEDWKRWIETGNYLPEEHT